ncbi:MAG: QueT transporter family protein [Ruminococcaceae bacterium]|nr:QueT transporter family protein [Oscillospiraceae bacterium]
MTFAAVLAAVYAVLTLVLPVPQYGPVQIRFAEALCVLPFFFPAATPGLFVGCVLANLASPYVLDVIFGSAATLLACLWTGRLRNRWLASLPAVVCNAVIVGAEIAFTTQAGFGPAFWSAFGFNALTVGAGELLACGLLGQLVLGVVYRTPMLRDRIEPARLSRLRGFTS